MAEENQFMIEMLRGIQSGVAETNQRLDRLDERMAQLERRQTASTHFEQSVLAHLASIHESVDNLRAEMKGIERRVAKVEAS
jgi:septal ring factor EnvC (AmiA/AmiB activator)